MHSCAHSWVEQTAAHRLHMLHSSECCPPVLLTAIPKHCRLMPDHEHVQAPKQSMHTRHCARDRWCGRFAKATAMQLEAAQAAGDSLAARNLVALVGQLTQCRLLHAGVAFSLLHHLCSRCGQAHASTAPHLLMQAWLIANLSSLAGCGWNVEMASASCVAGL